MNGVSDIQAGKAFCGSLWSASTRSFCFCSEAGRPASPAGAESWPLLLIYLLPPLVERPLHPGLFLDSQRFQ